MVPVQFFLLTNMGIDPILPQGGLCHQFNGDPTYSPKWGTGALEPRSSTNWSSHYSRHNRDSRGYCRGCNIQPSPSSTIKFHIWNTGLDKRTVDDWIQISKNR